MRRHRMYHRPPMYGWYPIFPFGTIITIIILLVLLPYILPVILFLGLPILIFMMFYCR